MTSIPTHLRVYVETPDEKRHIDFPLTALDPKLSAVNQAMMMAKVLMSFGVSDEDGAVFFPAHTIYKMEMLVD